MKRYLMLSVFLVGAAAAQPAGQAAAGNDYLARLLHQGEISWGMMLAGLAVAFALGAVHAMSPGHGKTIVAAYLVGSRGTASHAIFLGGMVTFTHTITVFLLGLGTLFLSRYILPEKIVPVLGVISGVSIVWIGAILLYKRIQAARHMRTHKLTRTPTRMITSTIITIMIILTTITTIMAPTRTAMATATSTATYPKARSLWGA
jgi:hypothetical protein